MASDPRATPAFQQYLRFKARHPGCVLLFRIGDFYEMFDEDAVAVSKAIGLTLTRRTEGVPMAGMPYHQLELYLRKLLTAGFRVAVCDQVEQAESAAAKARGLVARAVTRVVTPGTLVDESLLDSDAPSAVAAIAFLESGDAPSARAAVATIDVSTGVFTITDGPASAMTDELLRRGVRELAYADAGSSGSGGPPPRVRRIADALGIAATPRPGWHFRADEAVLVLKQQFGVGTLSGYGLRDDDPALAAAGAVLAYVKETQASLADVGSPETPPRGKHVPAPELPQAALSHLKPPRRDAAAGALVLDAVTLRALEIERPLRGGGVEGSLLGVFLGHAGCCRTPMGRRLLRDWLVRPLSDLAAIRARQDVVGFLCEERRAAEAIGQLLSKIQDVARIAGRVPLRRATPRDLVALGRSLAAGPELAQAMEGAPALASIRQRLVALLAPLEKLCRRLLGECVDDPPPHMREGGLFRDGFDAELDEARLLQRDAGSWLAHYQSNLAEKLRLPGLKVGFNKVFGYYIELTAAAARNSAPPPELKRKQTLKNAERYTTIELQEFETKVTTAEARALERERQLFEAICAAVAVEVHAVGAFADAVAELDALCGMSERAVRRGWKRPEIVEEPTLVIHAGRHPVLEESLGSSFVPNDVELGGSHTSESPPAKPKLALVGTEADEAGSATEACTALADPAARPALALITGPNMAGKSTYIRQVALIVLLAHTGSFVPADRATIGLTDRIFTRIGADDALHAGQSTFMVEMTETANILHHATGRSLVVLDEVGRGTSTLDGLSLAWAIVEHLAGADAVDPARKSGSKARVAGTMRERPRALFATHYHELTQLEEALPGRVQNLHVAVREWPPGDPNAEIIFVHRILPGRTDQSYGLHVAKLAGIPQPVIARAREVLSSLSVEHSAAAKPVIPPPKPAREAAQLPLFTEYLAHPAVDALREIKLDALSPLQAFDTLRKLQDLAGNG
jgi:DNA mismatch repair protein MutS